MPLLRLTEVDVLSTEICKQDRGANNGTASRPSRGLPIVLRLETNNAIVKPLVYRTDNDAYKEAASRW